MRAAAGWVTIVVEECQQEVNCTNGKNIVEECGQESEAICNPWKVTFARGQSIPSGIASANVVEECGQESEATSSNFLQEVATKHIVEECDDQERYP